MNINLRNSLILSFMITISACSPSLPTAAEMVAVEATANPALVATVQADQYWRDAQATTQAYQATLEANYRSVETTAQAATSAAVAQQVQATATMQMQQTRDALSLALTADAATSQARETTVSATEQAASTATAQAHQNAIATSTAVAVATASAFAATRQALELEQAKSQAQREHFITIITTVLLVSVIILAVTLLGWFFWQVIPTLVNRVGVVRYGQHGNPLLMMRHGNQMVVTDPLRMLQAALVVNGEGHPVMPELSPNELQTLVAGGALRTLIEQTHYAPGHPPQLPAEIIHERRIGPFTNVTTTRHLLPASSPTVHETDKATTQNRVANKPLALPAGAISWHVLESYTGNGLVLGMGNKDIISLDLMHTPHILLAGSSGAGKTRRAVRPLVAQALGQGMIAILMNESGADFSPFYHHPNAVLYRGDVPAYISLLESITAEMNRRETILRRAYVSEWWRLPEQMRNSPPILVVIDEILSLALLMAPREQKAFWGLLATYASRARKLSMGSIGALTDPTYRILGAGLNWREQCSARITFRVTKAAISRAVLDANGAETLDEGQFLARLGPPVMVRGVAANPTNEELTTYLTRRPIPPLPRPDWLIPLIESNPGEHTI